MPPGGTSPEMAALSDAQLVASARSGSRDAFAVLVDRHYPLLLSCCRRAAGEGAAADAAQEAVLQALLGLRRLRRDDSFGPWLVGIGLNVSRRLLEQRARQGVALDATAEPVAPGPEPHELVESAFAAARVREAIAALPGGQRDAVTLFYLSGLSQAEVAEHLGTAVGAVKTRLHKARASLQHPLSDLRKEPMPVPTVPMRIADVRDTGRAEILSSHVIFLEEEAGPRRLPIWVGAAEATTLALRLRDVELPRPGTYELAGDLLRAAGAHLREVRVVALTESIFYAEAVLDDGTTVDARPSDALNLALVLDVPVLVDEAVLAQAADEDAATRDMLAQALSSPRDAGAIADEVSRARLAEQARPGGSGT
jgi:RNA polymerase sigma factor (sigma-70 family)